jgi:hypothetical protein
METPEKIYIRVKNGKVLNTWNSMWKGVNDVEYLRKDAFMEKVYKCIKENFPETDSRFDEDFTEKLISSFRKVVEE